MSTPKIHKLVGIVKRGILLAIPLSIGFIHSSELTPKPKTTSSRSKKPMIALCITTCISVVVGYKYIYRKPLDQQTFLPPAPAQPIDFPIKTPSTPLPTPTKTPQKQLIKVDTPVRIKTPPLIRPSKEGHLSQVEEPRTGYDTIRFASIRQRQLDRLEASRRRKIYRRARSDERRVQLEEKREQRREEEERRRQRQQANLQASEQAEQVRIDAINRRREEANQRLADRDREQQEEQEQRRQEEEERRERQQDNLKRIKEEEQVRIDEFNKKINKVVWRGRKDNQRLADRLKFLHVVAKRQKKRRMHHEKNYEKLASELNDLESQAEKEKANMRQILDKIERGEQNHIKQVESLRACLKREIPGRDDWLKLKEVRDKQLFELEQTNQSLIDEIARQEKSLEKRAECLDKEKAQNTSQQPIALANERKYQFATRICQLGKITLTEANRYKFQFLFGGLKEVEENACYDKFGAVWSYFGLPLVGIDVRKMVVSSLKTNERVDRSVKYHKKNHGENTTQQPIALVSARKNKRVYMIVKRSELSKITDICRTTDRRVALDFIRDGFEQRAKIFIADNNIDYLNFFDGNIYIGSFSEKSLKKQRHLMAFVYDQRIKYRLGGELGFATTKSVIINGQRVSIRIYPIKKEKLVWEITFIEKEPINESKYQFLERQRRDGITLTKANKQKFYFLFRQGGLLEEQEENLVVLQAHAKFGEIWSSRVLYRARCARRATS